MYDLIGDIHGHAEELVQLLERLGYQKAGQTYRHPERQVIFLGDFIDRGPAIRHVLEVVRPMVEDGHALAVLGNHELNALAYHTVDQYSPGNYLRRRCAKNTHQHQATLDQLTMVELSSHLKWFRSLPMWLDLDGLRVVHACWDPSAMALIREAIKSFGGITTEFLHSACRQGQSLFAPVETVLKGKEGKLPRGITIEDKDGHPRTAIRTRWYLDPAGHTYRTYAFQADEIDCDLELDSAVIEAAIPYPPSEKPVFIGHYWLSGEQPTILADNVACLDFSVAKGGFLCAYRWNREHQLRNENFVWIKKA